uniref:Uncharacterized protein n=1 Tax=Spumella elongata TaxID=89044 RepID=A0A7S3M5K8_9STRA
MSTLSERAHARTDALVPELDTSFDLGDDDDSVFREEPPCLCAQQIISTLFGTVLGYIAALITPTGIYFPLAFAQGLGITMGLLGSEKSNIKAIGLREPTVVLIVMILTTYIFVTVVGALNEGEISLGTLLWTSFVLANLASWVRSITRYPPQTSSPHSDSGASSPATPYSSPKKTLKCKNSGDANDWYGKNSNIIKV